MNNKSPLFQILLIVLFLCYLVQYILDIEGIIIKYPTIADAIIYLIICFLYLWKYRRDNLLCFEALALPVIFLGIFFEDLIFPLVTGEFNYHTIGNDDIKAQSADLQMMAYSIFLIGCSRANKKSQKKTKHESVKLTNNVNYNIFVKVLSIILFLILLYDYKTGIFNSWFYYNNTEYIDFEDRNQGLGHITCLLLALTASEITRLRNLGVNNLFSFIKCVNKLYLVEWIFVSCLLYATGNRNEMLLILLPLLVAYSICIKPIRNKTLLIFGTLGILLMVIVSTTRQGDSGVSIEGATFNLLSFTIDFASLGFNCNYLVGYTDQHGPTFFAGLWGQILSGIPYIGPVILNIFQIKGPVASSTLTTEAAGTISGMGTSLIGDLYYCGGLIWVLVFMFFLGYIMSYIYYSDKKINTYVLMFYSYMVANSIYYIRSQWAFPITILEYTTIILILGNVLFRKKQRIIK